MRVQSESTQMNVVAQKLVLSFIIKELSPSLWLNSKLQVSLLSSGSPHSHQNHHWRLLNACWRLPSRLDRQIGDCMATVYNTLVYTQYMNLATTFAQHTPQFT